VALRLLTACDHGEEQPGSCPDGEPLPPLVQLALSALPQLCPTVTDIDSAALDQALAVVEARGGWPTTPNPSKLPTVPRHASAG
jgi:hypothetical protein